MLLLTEPTVYFIYVPKDFTTITYSDFNTSSRVTAKKIVVVFFLTKCTCHMSINFQTDFVLFSQS